MKILLLGSGAREHAIAKKIRESKLCKELYISPANAGMISEGVCVNLGNDFEKIKACPIKLICFEKILFKLNRGIKILQESIAMERKNNDKYKI
mgnify:CR=1 FL=1